MQLSALIFFSRQKYRTSAGCPRSKQRPQRELHLPRGELRLRDGDTGRHEATPEGDAPGDADGGAEGEAEGEAEGGEDGGRAGEGRSRGKSVKNCARKQDCTKLNKSCDVFQPPKTTRNTKGQGGVLKNLAKVI